MEQRRAYFKTDFQAREAQDGGKTIEGYFIVYNQETELWPGFRESVAPGACKNALAGNDIRALFNHNNDIVLGRMSAGTLQLREDEKGVYGSILVNEQDTEAMNIYARVQRGDVTGCSFGFWPTEEQVEYLDNGDVKSTILAADVSEVSVCPFPAYPQTSIEARKRAVETLAKERLKQKRSELKERFEKWQKASCC